MGFAQQIILKGVGFTAHKAIGNNLHFKIFQYGKSEGIFVLNIWHCKMCKIWRKKYVKYMSDSLGAKSME